MPLSESTLAGWAAAPADSKAIEAHKQVDVALKSSPLLAGHTVDVYLQGSYRNRTHIKSDSDVDVVVELSSTFQYNVDSLSYSEKSLFEAVYPGSATYGYPEFRRHVGQVLASAFGAGNVTEGKKCFKVAGNSQRLKADVLPCLEYRKYVRFSSRRQEDQPYIPGIRFFAEGQSVTNWPKVHFKNAAAKNERTGEQFKPLVRILKQMRTLLIEVDALQAQVAPSYFVECLAFNIPDSAFGTSHSATVAGGLRFLATASLSNFRTVSEQDPLFGGNKGWNEDQARTFIRLAANALYAVNQT